MAPRISVINYDTCTHVVPILNRKVLRLHGENAPDIVKARTRSRVRRDAIRSRRRASFARPPSRRHGPPALWPEAEVGGYPPVPCHCHKGVLASVVGARRRPPSSATTRAPHLEAVPPDEVRQHRHALVNLGLEVHPVDVPIAAQGEFRAASCLLICVRAAPMSASCSARSLASATHGS